MDDALELLGPGFSDRQVRAFAVKRLERAEDEVSVIPGQSDPRNSYCTFCSSCRLSNLNRQNSRALVGRNVKGNRPVPRTTKVGYRCSLSIAQQPIRYLAPASIGT